MYAPVYSRESIQQITIWSLCIGECAISTFGTTCIRCVTMCVCEYLMSVYGRHMLQNLFTIISVQLLHSSTAALIS